MSWLPSSESTFRLVSVSCSCTRPGSSSFRPSLRACWRAWWQCPCPSRNPTIQRIGSTTSQRLRACSNLHRDWFSRAYKRTTTGCIPRCHCGHRRQLRLRPNRSVPNCLRTRCRGLQYTSGSTSNRKVWCCATPISLPTCGKLSGVRTYMREFRRHLAASLSRHGSDWRDIATAICGLPSDITVSHLIYSATATMVAGHSQVPGDYQRRSNFAYDLCVKKAASLESHIDLSSWDLAFNGAEPVRASTLNAFSAAFAHAGFRRTAFVPCYGLAEATLIVSAARKNREPLIIESSDPQLTTHGVNVLAGGKLVSCGPSTEGARVDILRTDSEACCLEGEIGEIFVASQALQTDIGEERPGVPTWLA